MIVMAGFELRANSLRRSSKIMTSRTFESRVDLSQFLETVPGDLVFICREGKILEFHSEVLVTISPMIREILKDSFVNSYFLPKDYKSYISLDFDKEIVLNIMNSIYERSNLIVTDENSNDVSSVFEALGLDASMFSPSSGRIGKDEDAAIVDVISNLMDEYNVNPNQSEQEMTEMLMTTLDENFINEINSTLDGSSTLETLLVEPIDEITEGNHLNEELTKENSEVAKKRKIKPTRPRIRECKVVIENLSNKTLSHYYEVYLKNKKEKVSESVEEGSLTVDPSKRKRKPNMSPDYEYNMKRKGPKSAIPRPFFLDGESSLSSQIPGPKISTPKPMVPGPRIEMTLPPSFVEGFHDPPIEENVSMDENSSTDLVNANVKIEDEDTTMIQSANEDSNSQIKVEDINPVYVKQVKCLICEDFFNTRSKLLHHVTASHFTNQIAEKFPFTKSECSVCLEQRRPKPLVAKSKQSHILHVGSFHEEVMNLLPEHFKEIINREFSVRKKSSKIKIKEEPTDDSMISAGSVDSVNESLQNSFATEKLHKSPQIGEVFQDEDANMCPPNYPASEAGDLACSLCPNTETVNFKFRSQMLSHLSNVHLPTELMTLYSLTNDGRCGLCLDSGVSDVFHDSQAYVNHVGSFHEKVLEILPTDFCERIESMPRDTHGVWPPAYLDTSFNVSFQSSLNSTSVLDDSSINQGNIGIDQQLINTNSNSNQSNISNSSLNKSDLREPITKFIELGNRVADPIPSDPKIQFSCKHCQEIFSSSEERRVHIQRSHNMKRKHYSCRYCDSKFTDPKPYRLHLLAHKKDFTKQ